MKYIWLLLLGLALAPAAWAGDDASDEGASISRAGFAEGRLWLLSSAGEIHSLAENDADSRQEDAGGKVADICVLDGRLIAGIVDPGSLALRTLDSGVWSDMARFSLDGATARALLCADHAVTVVTTQKIVTVSGSAVEQVVIKGEPPKLAVPEPYALVTVAGTKDRIFIGYSRGEWGGYIDIIDRKTGDRGGGPFDDVNGMVAAPWKPDCVAVAGGLVHMYASGAIYVACSDKFDDLYRRQFGDHFPNQDLPEKDAYQTMPFWGIAASGQAVVAIGLDGLYRVTSDGKAVITPMPEFKKVGSFYVSFALPDVVLVETSIHRATSVSGAVPLMVAR